MSPEFKFSLADCVREYAISFCGTIPQREGGFMCGIPGAQIFPETCFGFPVRLEAGTLAFSLPMPEYSFGFIHSVGASLRAGAYRLINAATDFYCTVSNLVKTGTKRVKHQCIRVMKDIPKAFAHVSRTVLGWRL